jgi:hypothetical protein
MTPQLQPQIASLLHARRTAAVNFACDAISGLCSAAAHGESLIKF